MENDDKQQITRALWAICIFIAINWIVQPLLNHVLAFPVRGLSGLFATIVGIVVILLLSTSGERQSFLGPTKKEHMRIWPFLMLICIACLIEVIGKSVGQGITTALYHMTQSQFQTGVQNVTKGVNNTFFFVVYSLFIAPFLEEAVFRGYLLHRLEKFGPTVAIFVSALAYAIFHASVVTISFIFLLSLLLGYISYQYGVRWAIFFHMVDNAFIPIIASFFPISSVELTEFAIYIVGALIACLILLMNLEQIILWFKTHKSKEHSWNMVLVNVPMGILLVAGIIAYALQII
ncbi:lysostaphin resistance A-like protein [Ligilactobacillus sp. LYQ139]|uniref:CPBP family intramembrane glutamic endopeptidase n=1 Tax=Ligilactobacillus sp. LYQ139 TaxID=3378800 RepID=UPI003853C64C